LLGSRTHPEPVQIAGYRASIFESAESFLNTDVQAADCVVLGVTLPGMSGLALQRHLLDTSCAIPMVFVTSNLEHMREQALSHGAVAVVEKPFADTD
jgi:FixJ family two-component response regulator